MWIDTPGRKLYAYTGGRAFDAGQPSVVFVHGAQHDHSVWILQSRFLAHHGRSVLALDLPGHGRSEGPLDTSVEAMADSVIAAMTAAGVERAAIVGHSMGSLIALECAARAPDRVERIALLGAAYPMKVSDVLLEAAANDEPKAMDMINRWSHSGINFRPGSPAPGFSVYWQNRRLMARQAPGTLLSDFRACDRYEGGLAAAAAVQCPVLFVIGGRDMMTPPKAADALAAAIGKAPAGIEPRRALIPGCGHALMSERPDEVLAALRDFLL
ncbi:MAG: alpha/beta hydrolase [Pseudomonadota bacterium]|jgi:pimeloyl-ACP methyl ester carboxylesterase|nr:alpha/beta hydrolase [Pseudomonadota bacterium]